MPVSKPTDLLDWAEDGAAVVDEPSAGLALVGYATRSKPTAGNYNWMFRAIFRWIAYINDQLPLTATPDASTTVKGLTKISVAPVSPTAPIAVGDNDTRLVASGETPASVLGGGKKIQSGRGTTSQVDAIVFPVAFVGTPLVFVCPDDSAVGDAGTTITLTARSNTGFTAYQTYGGGNVNPGQAYSWLAIGD